MKKAGIGIAAFVMLALTLSAADAQSRGDRSQARACRNETEAACVQRQMRLRDLGSGIAIQRGDAERFCSRQTKLRC